MNGQLIRVTDLTDSTRDAIVATADVAPLLAGWWRADGAAAHDSALAGLLAAAIAQGDWAMAHSVADHVSVDVRAVRSASTWSAGES